MRHTMGLRSTVAAAALLALAGPAYAQQAEADAPSKVDIEPIIVTAQKREQPLQDVPVSVTVIGAQALERARIDSGTEIARQTPNLRVSVLGDESQPKFSLRGISTPEFNLNAISPTGVFFDEVYVGASLSRWRADLRYRTGRGAARTAGNAVWKEHDGRRSQLHL